MAARTARKTTTTKANAEPAVDMSKVTPEVIAAAKAAMVRTGCPASVTIAQWADESEYGTILSGPFNCFGMTWEPDCGYPFKVQKTREYRNGQYVTRNGKFIAFPSWEAAFGYHGAILMDPKLRAPFASFSNIWNRTRDAYKAVDQLGNYDATNPNYVHSLRELMSEYKLTQYDSTSSSPTK